MQRTTKGMAIWFALQLCLLVSATICLSAETRLITSADKSDISLKKEVEHSVDRGLKWLQTQQNPQGYWSQPEHPALTALALTALMRDPSGQIKAKPSLGITKGYEYLLKCVQPDGGIYVKDMANYNTSVAMTALLAAYHPSHEPILLKARNYIIGLQSDFGEKGKTDDPYDGGIGYGGTYPHSDMSNTTFALESIYYTKFLVKDKAADSSQIQQLNWPAAIKFIERSQNLPGYNDQSWASDDPQNKGGFIYFPGDSKAGKVTLPSGKTALRSYGSISYAGLLSFAYADLNRDDARVKAVLDWLQKNYTLEENPGMGADGLYYYYHTMAKALSAQGVKTIKLQNGKEIDWRKDLALKLINLQGTDGSWVNNSGRWWEKDPVLVTCYAAIALEIIQQGL